MVISRLLCIIFKEAVHVRIPIWYEWRIGGIVILSSNSSTQEVGVNRSITHFHKFAIFHFVYFSKTIAFYCLKFFMALNKFKMVDWIYPDPEESRRILNNRELQVVTPFIHHLMKNDWRMIEEWQNLQSSYV